MKSKLRRVGEISFLMVSVFTLIVSFFVVYNFFLKSSDKLVSETQDQACKAYVAVLSDSTVNAAKDANEMLEISDSFYKLLNRRCKVDVAEIDAQSKEQVFEDIAKMGLRCWKRYGGDEYDFLSSWRTEGNWCFTCAQLSFDGNEGESASYAYTDFIEWAKKTTYKDGDVEKKYYSSMGLRYIDAKDNELLDLKEELLPLMEETDPSFNSLTNVVAYQYQRLLQMKYKELSLDDKLYVVYRFDRYALTDKEQYDEARSDILSGAIVGLVVGFSADFAITSAAVGACSVIAVFTSAGLGIPLCIGAGGVLVGKKVVGVIEKSSKELYKMIQLRRVMTKIKGLLRYSRDAADVSKMYKTATFVGKEAKILNKVDEFESGIKTLKILADGAEQAKDVKMLAALNKQISLLEDLKLTKIDDLSAAAFKSRDDILELRKFVESSDTADLVVDGFGLVTDLPNHITDTKKLSLDEIDSVLDAFDKNEKEVLGSLDMGASKYFLRLAGLAASGALVSSVFMDTNENKRQYIDIMTREEYYRECGFEPLEVFD